MKTDRARIRRHLSGTFISLTMILVLLSAQGITPDAGFAEARSPSSAMSTSNSDTVRQAIDLRQELLKRSVTVDFTDPAGEKIATWTVSMAEHPSWVVFESKPYGVGVAVDAGRVLQQLISYPVQNIPKSQSCFILSTAADEEGVERATTDCIAKSGYTYADSDVALLVKSAIEKGEATATVPLMKIEATVADSRSGEQFTLLSTGHSTFQGSGAGRKSNVRKVINEREHNVYVPAGAEFSFNDTLGTVSLSRGWQMALTIFEGANLRMAPGGGICQGSTTVYRAVLNAGLPVLKQKNHSLYVTYYEEFGVGLDATVFPGHQDFTFKNDTGGPILIQAYTEGDAAYVNLYGVDDGRSVEMAGPYFTKTAPDGLLPDNKKIRGNEIVWLRTIRSGNNEYRDVITARYKAIPKSLAAKYEAQRVIVKNGNLQKGLVAER